ncbi:MAG: 3-deoxy-8-phosphooctulonate synthase [Alphaproteobacteria bacterium]|nr:3-deoxy-8-phosphooctulonate synthase [Alphaproteobacteria bacterium]
MHKHIKVGSVTIGNNLPVTLISGPCQIESRDHALMMAEELVKITDKLGMSFVFKASFDKANRTSIDTPRGVGLDKGLEILAEIKKKIGCPTLTDIHEKEQCAPVAEVVDILQIPAFLCRQTDLLVEAAKTGAVVNVKKGQFLAPWDMKNVVKKISDSGNDNILLTDRGTSFGYNTLVSDMRGLPTMAATGYPVIFDATHSIQQPGGQGTTSGGQREFAPILARAATAIGLGGVFIECHDTPDKALSDGANSIRLDEIESVLKILMEFDVIAKKYPVEI